jgi:ABC-type branched-subunit amino acid transport system substrate-binding protein
MVTCPRLRVGACLSLSGRYARFGTQAAAGLGVWADLDGDADVVIEDDRSDPDAVEAALTTVASRSDVLLGPYSTQLVRRAAAVARESDLLLWNHGGAGDDVEAAADGHVVSVLTPASRYGEPFVRRLVADLADGGDVVLWVQHGTGRFGRQVAEGAAVAARQAGIEAVVVGPDAEPRPTGSPWHLFVAGTFEDDVAAVRRAMDMPGGPQSVCSVAAGVRAFRDALGRDPSGVFGVGQWFPGATAAPRLGPDERTFLGAYVRAAGGRPDYPALQAVAAAVIAARVTRLAGGSRRELVWPIATQIVTSTLFGPFAVDPITGVQVAHETTLVRWHDGGLAPATI